MEQYSVQKFAAALESFIKTFADNSGRKSNEVLARITAAHHAGGKNIGFDISDESKDSLCDAQKNGIVDLYNGKDWALQYATKAACTILNIDQIIMAKRAGAPKPRAAQGGDQDED